MRACFGISVDVSGATCTTNTETCTGDSITGCHVAATATTPAYDWSIDCARRGETCFQSTPSDLASCGPRPCSTIDGTCDGPTRIRICDGVGTPVPCQLGTSCMVQSGLTVCLGGPCETNACVGDTFEVCGVSHRVARVMTCAAWGQRCGTIAEPCVPVSTECDPVSSRASCDGAIVRYCAPSGQMRAFDCAAHGFGPCELRESDGRARCAPTGVRFD